MKIFALPPREDWICDRFVTEWKHANPNVSVENPHDADIIWLLADWCWNHLPVSLLESKKVVATVHHIVPSKFGKAAQNEFTVRDRLIDAYHVPCEKTEKQIRTLTTKPIYVMPFWVNQDLWYQDLNARHEIRNALGISSDTFLVGSFQRDTEGFDLKTPKLEKGPDILCDIIEKISEVRNVEVLLGGWRRQYVLERMNNARIKTYYTELPPLKTINKMYNALDLYIVGARWEGGPQAIVECALSKTPIISTDVGLASDILSASNIFTPDEFTPNMISNIEIEDAYMSVQKICMPNGFKTFLKMFGELL